MAEKVEIANKTGNSVLDAIIKATSKKLGTDMSGANYGDIVPFSSGSLKLDLALKVGGLPTGRIIEIMGGESTMKTSFCLQYIARKQQDRLARGVTDFRDVILDLEHTLTTSFIEGFGIDMSQIIWLKPKSAEEALQVLLDYVKSGFIDNFLIDSVDAMQNEKQQRRQVGENDVGGISKDMSFAIRQIAKLGPEYGTTYLFINQIRMNPGVMFGSPETTPGGKSLAFYASLRIKCLTRGKCNVIPNATMWRCRIAKTKLGGEYTETIEVPFVFGRGFSPALDISEVAKDYDLIRNSVGQTKVRWTTSSEWEPLLPDIEKGKDAGKLALLNNPWLLEKLRQSCFYEAGTDNAMALEDILAMGPPEQPGKNVVKPEADES